MEIEVQNLQPRIGTTALDANTKDHISLASGKITIVDKVKYENLIEGESYTLTGWPVDRETGKIIKDDNGNVVTVEKPFVATGKEGAVDVTFSFSGEKLAGKSITVFEELKWEGKVYASHKDTGAEEQSIYIPRAIWLYVNDEASETVLLLSGMVSCLG